MSMRVVSLSRTKVIALEPLLSGYGFKPYAHYPEIADERRTRYFLDEIQAARAHASTQFWIAPAQREVVGLASLTFLRWDSEQLGVRAGRIGHLLPEHDYRTSSGIKHRLLERIMRACETDHTEYVTVRVNAHETASIHVLEDNGFEMLDGILTFSCDLRKRRAKRARAGIETRLARRTDLREIQKIAVSSFRYDRFHTDPRIPEGTADSLHAAWLRNSLRGVGADAIVVGERHGRLHGFVTCRIDRASSPTLGLSLGSIVLVAVEESSRGKGVASAMTAGALDWFLEHGVDVVEVGTQLRNIEASRLYENMGFRLVASSVSMRKWIK